MDYVKPKIAIRTLAEAGKDKTTLSISVLLIRSILAGVILGYATTLAYTAATETGFDIVGAIIFPAGFVIIVLLNLELVTGAFAVMPISKFRNKVSTPAIVNNFLWIFIGNLVGSVFYALLFTIYISHFGHVDDSLMAQKLIYVAESKTLAYKILGFDGIIVVFVKALLCNFMIALAIVLNALSTSTIGKIAAMWLPLLIFFAQGFEHAVVNMFVIPAGMMAGAEISMTDWWLWNQIPVTIGNFVSAFLFVSLCFHVMTKEKE